VHYHSLQATKEQMQFYADVEKNETGIFWAVCSADNRYFMGVGGLNNIDTKHKKGEIGFWLMTEFWGQGIMTEAMPLICNYAFEYRGLHRIEGFVETHNRNCQKAMSKLRFTLEGTMRDCEIKNGNYI